jgi:CubicO group peptidase (beta-lactamase class C family)
MTGPVRDHPEVREALGLLESWLESQVAYAGWPGLSAAVVHDQTLIWSRGFGLADVERGEPATADTLYRIASVTKLFTATAIMQLRDAGKLRLDDPVTAYLPWFAMRSAHPEAPPITIRHLLTHTAGLPREAGLPYWTDGRFPEREELPALIAGLAPVLPSETRWKYTNLGPTLSGEVVAAVSGQPYARYVREAILEPLGMGRTLVESPPADHPGLAAGYTRRLPGARARERAPRTDGRGLTPAANMTTSATDLARFAMLQFRDGPAGGEQILRGSTLREMQRVHWLEPDWAAGWGLGFRVVRQGRRTLCGHGGRLRGYRTQLQLCPAERVGAIVMINADDGTPLALADRAIEWVAPAIAKATARERAAADPGWARYAGRYRSPWADMRVLVYDGGLVAIDPSLPDPTEGMTRLLPAGEHTFRMESADGYTSHGELIVFEMGPDGRVARVRIGANYAEPVAEW